MKVCSDVESVVTPYVDGEVTPDERHAVDEHLRACGPCRRGVTAESAARGVLRARGADLMRQAPPELRRVCGQSAVVSPRRLMRSWPLAMAATLVLAVAGALLYSTFINPAVAAAAQLTLDHLKCFTLFDEPAGLSAAEVRDHLRERHGWKIPVPDDPGDDLELVGGRRCVYLEGFLAHLLYMKGQVPVSVFVLPPGDGLHAPSVEVMGYTAVSFERGGRTWVVLARGAGAQVQSIANGFRGN